MSDSEEGKPQPLPSLQLSLRVALQPQSAESDTKNPHIWSTIDKTKLLEQLFDESSAGRATDNGNLKKEGRTNVMNKLNEHFGLNLNHDQIKNQKTVLQML
ncbi:hypothetical protein VP01_70g7 [Puccinia sorghi]|uniref:Myb/SANT-like domain-containing protein n=1 Tax=Puccinia sorghi TaxID=27349 RepID=A0A0L6UDJ2_9BASI|nr:hypothetical protein VP01_70g7 [Puccinia sorghi]